MKKVLLFIGALLICILVNGCGKSKVDGDVEDLLDKEAESTQNMIEHCAEWSVEDWMSYMNNANDLALEFWESDPSVDDIEEFDKLMKEHSKALDDIGEDAFYNMKIARNRLNDDDNFLKTMAKIKKTARKVRRKNKH